MRGRKTSVTAVRRPNGEIALETKPLSPIFTSWMRKTPLLRGIIVLIEALVLGIETLLYSANMALEDEEEKVSGGMMWLILAVSMAFAVALFFLVPLFAARLIDPYTRSPVIFNLIEGVIRLGLFIAYLKVISMLPDIKRVFAYHGAEHKAVNAYEHGVPLDVAAVRAFSTAHTRCGTSFLFVVMVIAIIVFTLVGLPSIWLMVLSRVVLIPVIAALGYEVVYFGARHIKNAFIRAVLAPGLWLQALTTREPDDSQLEVALAALKKATEDDQEVAQSPAAPI